MTEEQESAGGTGSSAPGATGPTSDPAAEALRRATRSTRPASAKRSRRRSPQAGSDPELVGDAIDRLLRDQGWTDRTAVATVMAEWSQIVGPDLAAHVEPVSFDEGRLVLQAESTTWATQVRLLLPQLQRALEERIGRGVVSRIEVLGPAAPTWGHGPRRVKGRGPRDTYG